MATARSRFVGAVWWTKLTCVVVVMAVASASGCGQQDETVRVEPVVEQEPEPQIVHRAPTDRKRVEPTHLVLGESVQGRLISCSILGQGDETVFIFAAIHGDEPAGTPLVHQLASYLETRPDLVRDRRIILMAVANPDGLAANSRSNSRNVDLNRNFPAGNFRAGRSNGSTALSEPESEILCRLLDKYRPDRIVSIHQPNSLKPCIDYDGPSKGLAEAMADQCDLPIIKLGSRPGSLGSYAGLTLGLPIITLELPRTPQDSDGEVLWDRYGRMMLAAICYPEEVHAVDVPALAE